VKDLLLTDHETAINAALGTGDREDLEPLVQVARSLYSMHRSLRGSRRRPKKRTLGKASKVTTPEVGQYERFRAVVLSEYLAKMAAIDPEVVRFRDDLLGSELLSPEEARASLSSPATHYLSRGVWRVYGIPAKHKATLLDESYGRTEDGPFHWVQVRPDPPEVTHAVFIPNPQSYSYLTYFAEDGRAKRVGFWLGSVLGGLHRLCKELTKGTRGISTRPFGSC
jgi:hypothetical protein